MQSHFALMQSLSADRCSSESAQTCQIWALISAHAKWKEYGGCCKGHLSGSLNFTVIGELPEYAVIARVCHLFYSMAGTSGQIMSLEKSCPKDRA